MNEEFTQRLAALEKKFQQAIREKEALRKQLEVIIVFQLVTKILLGYW